MEGMQRGTGMETIQEERTDIRLDEGDHERFAHYVFPVCPECKRLYDLGREGRRREWEERARGASFGGTD